SPALRRRRASARAEVVERPATVTPAPACASTSVTAVPSPPYPPITTPWAPANENNDRGHVRTTPGASSSAMASGRAEAGMSVGMGPPVDRWRGPWCAVEEGRTTHSQRLVAGAIGSRETVALGGVGRDPERLGAAEIAAGQATP